MNEKSEPNVGLRLRALRDQQGLSLRALAEECGLSINAISLIERSENSPTVSTLHRLATALNVPITYFFQEDTRQMVAFTKRDNGLQSQSEGVVMESLGIGLPNQQMEPFRMIIEPGSGNIHDPIAHAGEEFVHCLQGEIQYFIGDRAFRLEAGDSLLFEAMQPHSYLNQTEKPVIILLIFQESRNLLHIQQMHLRI
jgi:transcriptional regulator with XRE-family HTH domain